VGTIAYKDAGGRYHGSGINKRLADFLHKLLPDYTSDPKIEVQQSATQMKIPTPKRSLDSGVEIIDDVREFDETPRFLDKLCGIRRDGDTFMIGNSVVSVDESNEITFNGKRFRGTKGLWELNRKNFYTDDHG
jgi:hypothetical protein